MRIDRWQEAVEAAAEATDNPGIARFARQLATDPVGHEFLAGIFGGSPFLTECAIADPLFLQRLIENGPNATYAAIKADLGGAFQGTNLTNDPGPSLRIAKRRTALTVALADITGHWELSQVTGTLSDFAETALSLAAAHLLAKAAARGTIDLADPNDPERESGLIILGMGKLGARELNYSSDIDIIVLYDPDRARPRDPDALQTLFVHLTRDLVRLMDERTADGYVFRTDLRLRPDPGSTPPAISTLAAEIYYESLGQNWERAAMIKARPVAGDHSAGQDFLNMLKPFIWRKNLDFAAIQDIHSIKRQIHAQQGASTVAVAGHNVKLGRGGIREIEFFIQTQQLIWGGRVPKLRPPTTLGALNAMVQEGRVEPATAREMSSAYCYLRQVEHRLQMIADAQTHSLPDDPAALEAFAAFMGYDAVADFSAALLGHLQRVESHYAELFEDAPSLGAGGGFTGNLVFTGSDPDPETLKTLENMGFKNSQAIDVAVRGWHHGHYRAARSTRTRQMLTELMPVLLLALARSVNPDDAFLKFDRFLSKLPSGVQLFAMFYANPQLLELVAEIVGMAPRLAEHLGTNPTILDTVLGGDFFDPPPPYEALLAELEEMLTLSTSIETVLDVARRWAKDRQFQVGVLALRGLIEPRDMAQALSNIADAALDRLFARVTEEFSRLHGLVGGAEIAIIALGKLGSREMTPTSDLDLIFVYDLSTSIEASDGPKPLTPTQYFARLSQRMINAISAQTNEGRLYEVDMRLRPSGNSGPIASSFDAFVQYHDDQAWTWEHLALTRARLVCGEEKLRTRLEGKIQEILTGRREAAKLTIDVADMRARIDKEFHTTSAWETKYLRGGLLDIEFIAQYLQLLHAHSHPEILARGTRSALENLRSMALLDGVIADRLIAGFDFWQSLQGILRLTMEGALGDDQEREMTAALRDTLCRAGGAVDFKGLKDKIQTTATAIYTDFQTIIEIPAQSANQELDGAEDPNKEEKI